MAASSGVFRSLTVMEITQRQRPTKAGIKSRCSGAGGQRVSWVEPFANKNGGLFLGFRSILGRRFAAPFVRHRAARLDYPVWRTAWVENCPDRLINRSRNVLALSDIQCVSG